MLKLKSIESRYGIGEPDYDPPADPPVVVSPHEPIRWREQLRRLGRRLVALAIVAVLIIAWQAGTFDHILVNVGLNAEPCARNGFGAVFCGKELEERQAQQEQAKQEGDAAEEKAQQAAEASKREGEELQAKIRRESQEAQSRSEEAIRRSTEETE